MSTQPAAAKKELKSRFITVFELLKAAGEKWSSDNVPRLSAAFSFYAMLSLAPFMVLGTVVAVAFVGTDPSNQFSLLYRVRETMGPQAAD
jgi:uncharacterized BrkB/YihY/UPF0761 family membrane protein